MLRTAPARRVLLRPSHAWATALALIVSMVSATADAQRPRERADQLAQPAPGRAGTNRALPSSATPIPSPPGSGAIPAPPGAFIPPPADRSRAATSATASEDTTRQRLRLVDEHLLTLSARSNNAILDGVMSTISGGLLIGLGVYAKNADETQIATYWFLSGATSLASAIVSFSLSPNVSRWYRRFEELPQTTPEQRSIALAYGESVLERIARRQRASRMVNASLSIASSLASLPILLGGDGFSSGEPYDYIVALMAGITVITGITNMVTRSEAERRWSAYRRQRAALGGDTADGPGAPERGLVLEGFGAGPVPQGGMGAVRFRF